MVKEVGQLLQETRESQGISLKDAATTLKIRPYYLSAIEDGKINEVLSPVYIAGYLRSYANFLGLNGDYIVNYFRSYRVEENPSLFPLPEPYRDDLRPGFATIIASVLLTLIIYGIWYKIHAEGTLFSIGKQNILSEALSTTTYKDDFTKTSKSSSTAASATALYNFSAPSPQASTKVVLLAKGNSWIRILDAHSRILTEKTLQAGDTFFVPDEHNLVIIAENPEVIEVLENGELTTLQEVSSQRIRNVSR